ncbi:M15 family metallopeptidase [Streptococcus phocae subsp. phocae]
MKNKGLKLLLQGLVVLLFVSGIYLFVAPERPAAKPITKAKPRQTKVAKKAKAIDRLPDVSIDDWQLVLVNRDNTIEEISPELADINGISVDKRIEQDAADFLAAAQTVDPQEHLISGYRSVAYQEQLYQTYIDRELASNPNLTKEEAEKQVQTYSQPPGASEHHTGLAIDMSTVDSLNASDPAVAKEIERLAPQFGFVLRFPKGKKEVTGVDYEDWHYRYVGKASAKYMVDNNLTLEEYVEQLKENK